MAALYKIGKKQQRRLKQRAPLAVTAYEAKGDRVRRITARVGEYQLSLSVGEVMNLAASIGAVNMLGQPDRMHK